MDNEKNVYRNEIKTLGAENNNNNYSPSRENIINNNNNDNNDEINNNSEENELILSKNKYNYEFELKGEFRQQETGTYCSAACSEMLLLSILHSFPSPLTNIYSFIPSQSNLMEKIIKNHQDATFTRRDGSRKGSDPTGLAVSFTEFELALFEELKGSRNNFVDFSPVKWRVYAFDRKLVDIDEIIEKLATIMVISNRPIVILTLDGRHYEMWSGFRSTSSPSFLSNYSPSNSNLSSNISINSPNIPTNNSNSPQNDSIASFLHPISFPSNSPLPCDNYPQNTVVLKSSFTVSSTEPTEKKNLKWCR